MPYEVRTAVFEGPFDLLLHLILRQEVELWEVSLSAIVDTYLLELERMADDAGGPLDLELATEFLLIAATLVELKARRLLPGLEDLELDEELLRFEERDLLLARLLECKTFKDAAAAFDAAIRRSDRSLPRRLHVEEPFLSLAPDPLERIRPAQLRAAALKLLAAKPEVVVDTEHIAPVRASVRDAVETVLRLLPEGEPMSFRSLVAGVEHRVEFVVRFLAVLELYKQGLVDLVQFTNFGDLTVRRLQAGESLDVTTLDYDEWDEPGAASSSDEADDDVQDDNVERGMPDRRGSATVSDEHVVDLGEDRDDAREAARAVEAVLMAATEPVEAQLLAELLEMSITDVEALCDDLAASYEHEARGFVIARVAGGYRFQTHPDLAPYVERYVLEGQHSRLSAPALETLAIVAYKQPISRGQISAIRGVNVEATMTTLLQRGYVEEIGRDPGPGQAVLYGTTTQFLERLGLNSVRDLPSLGDFIPDASVVEALERGLRVEQDVALSFDPSSE